MASDEFKWEIWVSCIYHWYLWLKRRNVWNKSSGNLFVNHTHAASVSLFLCKLDSGIVFALSGLEFFPLVTGFGFCVSGSGCRVLQDSLPELKPGENSPQCGDIQMTFSIITWGALALFPASGSRSPVSQVLFDVFFFIL